MVQFILPLVPQDFNHYYEPFLGSGALFFTLQPKRAFLSDKNPDLIYTYTQVRDDPEGVIRQLQKLRNTKKDYYAVRSASPQSEPERAARLIYLSTLSFNGIHRVNLKGEFNVPYGYKTHLRPCNAERVRAASELLRRARINCEDFELAVAGAQKGDLVYLDPPYTTTHANNGFLKYNAKIFTWNDQKRLAEVAHKLASRGCSVIVSNADHFSIRTLYGGFKILEIHRYSIIAASREFRRRVTECVFYGRQNKHVG